jgi:hypothetical protein
MSDPYELFTRAQIAERLHCTVGFVTELTTGRRLHSIRVGKRVLIPRASLEAFIRGEAAADTDGNWPPTMPLFDSAVDGSHD